MYLSGQVGGVEIERVTKFKYLGRVVSDDDNYAVAIGTNLKNARTQWVIFKKPLTTECASRRVVGHLYKAIVQLVLIYGSESWILSPRMLRTFNRKAARYITKRHIRPTDDESDWICSEGESVLADATR